MAFARLMNKASEAFEADLALVDIGPNLGAINRAALVSCDHVVLPLAPDLFSLQGLRNVGPILRKWRNEWQERKEKKPDGMSITLPKGGMKPTGYVVMRHSMRLDRPVRIYQKWIDRIPEEYSKYVLEQDGVAASVTEDPHCLAHLKDYRSLMPLAQGANKPMFALKPADGVFGAQQSAVTECRKAFRKFAQRLAREVGISM